MSCVGEGEWDIMTFREVARPVEREVARVVAARSSGAPVRRGPAGPAPARHDDLWGFMAHAGPLRYGA